MHVYRGCLSSGCNIKEMNNDTFIIAEFHDGLQLIPAAWYNADNLSSIWPTHFKTKLRINKAIMTKEMPREKSDCRYYRLRYYRLKKSSALQVRI